MLVVQLRKADVVKFSMTSWTMLSLFLITSYFRVLRKMPVTSLSVLHQPRARHRELRWLLLPPPPAEGASGSSGDRTAAEKKGVFVPRVHWRMKLIRKLFGSVPTH